MSDLKDLLWRLPGLIESSVSCAIAEVFGSWDNKLAGVCIIYLEPGKFTCPVAQGMRYFMGNVLYGRYMVASVAHLIQLEMRPEILQDG